MTSSARLRTGAMLAAIVATSAISVAQDVRGEIYGTLRDRDNGMIPGVTIALDGRRLSAPLTATADRRGAYKFDVPAGPYVLRPSLRGFKAVTRESITVTAGGRTEVNLELTVLSTHAVGLGDVMPREYLDGLATLKPGEIPVALDVYGGRIAIAIDTVHAPITAANFLKYVDGGFYDLGRFHRVTRPDNYTPAPPNRPAMAIIQAGPDPFRWRDALPPIPLERTSVTGLKHTRGVVSMARGNSADTATSDFFILLDDQPSLDSGGKRFDDGQGGAAFGRVVYGMDVVAKIQHEGPLRPAPNQQYLETPIQIIRASRISK